MRKGVFATRSPFRPNHLGLSCVRLEKVEHSGNELLEVEFEIERLSEETASVLEANLKRRRWF